MANIAGASGTILPGPYTSVTTAVDSGVSVPGGLRISSIIGLGQTQQTLVAGALGSGKDGLDPTFTSPTGADGRHFILGAFPVVEHQTTLYKNGLPLVGVENVPLLDSFPDQYDYQFDYATGQIELQNAYLFNQGGAFFVPGNTNVGVGTINGLTLEDTDAPAETWSLRCIGVQRNAMNQPIAGTAQFSAIGTISGNILDANGNPVIWIANNTTATNGILSFAVQETNGVPFRQGDYFTVVVHSGMLNRGDTLTATYIPVSNLNNPTFLNTMPSIMSTFGAASTANNLTLGCQLAFANSAPGIMCVQAAPSLPIRTSYVLTESMPALSTDPNDFIFPLPVGVVPDLDSSIHFFITPPSTGVETQILPNQFPFYTLGTAGQPTVNEFIFSATQPPAGNLFSYSVIQSYESLATGFDGYITANPALGVNGYGSALNGIFSSESTIFDDTYVGMVLRIIDSNDVANITDWIVTGVANGDLYVELAQGTNPPGESAATDFSQAWRGGTNLSLSFVSSGVTPGGFTVPENAATTEAFELYDPVSGLTVAGSAATNGTITAGANGTATLTSSTINFASFSPISNGYLLKVNGSVYNTGTYNVTNATTNSISISMTVATDFDTRFEVLDTSVTAANFIVINQSVVPNLNELRIDIVDARDAGFFDAGWINALASLETQEIDILVTLPQQTISVIFQNARNHCITMSSILNKKERVLFTGAISGLTPSNLTGATLAAVESIGILEGIQGNTPAEVLAGDTEDLANYSVPDAFGFGSMAYRTVYFYPDQIIVQAGADNVLIDGFYIAAAAAGYMSAQTNVAMPLTNKVLGGFSILQSKTQTPATYAQLAAAGVTSLMPVQGGGNVVWGITTTQSGFPEEQEISIVFIRDRIAKSLRSGFAAFVGLPADDSFAAKLTAQAQAMLNAFISQGLITGFANLLIAQDSVDPTQWNISVFVAPVFPVNVIYISVSVGTL